MYMSNQRVDKGLQTHKNKFVAENREIVLAVFRTVLYLAKQNLAYRGHDEKIKSSNRGNFLELIHLLGKYNLIFHIIYVKLVKIQKKIV